MRGKTKKQRRKTGKIILLCMSFLLVAVLTFTLTMAWFYDADWASNEITMAGAVGIEIRDENNNRTSTDKTYHFFTDTTPHPENVEHLKFQISTNLAYPGQSIDVHAKVHNNGGKSGANGSPCYVRASFRVYTDIGTNTFEGDASATEEQEGNATAIYTYLFGLISRINNDHTNYPYKWVYFRNKGSMMIENNPYFNGVMGSSTSLDDGYFYLCYDPDAAASTRTIIQRDGHTSYTITSDGVLYSLGVGADACFLWDGQFVIPWTLTNYSADKHMYVCVAFEAIQTFIPIITPSTGVIRAAANNQLSPEDCKFNSSSVQTVFHSSNFAVDPKLATDLARVFGGSAPANISIPFSSLSDASYSIIPGATAGDPAVATGLIDESAFYPGG